ncbi:unnamed protein product [Didymodactylos carnosus]|uniref:Integrase catalytic domain-containing protein n=1 Tax=Didymodactylos carnosus TaxID=1234261 RepID=A0A8S2IIS4_9BILA|nr:unnamed protein product [Didymodactylos carnosus]CAF3733835.1 unnamed protein product [Didymodactylos carnosus]
MRQFRTAKCQKAFNNLVQDIFNTVTLAHFDTQLPIILATDASNHGIGAVIMHRYSDGSERPIAHASKTLTAAERNYSQIEKEALSTIFGIKKFHQYLGGRSLELNTGHQPLLTIFNPTKDALSRLPVGDDDPSQINYIQTQLIEQWPLKPTEIATATTNDHTLKVVRHFTLTKWPSSFSGSKNPELIPYYNNRYSLLIVNGCILKDTQVIISKQLHNRALHMLHRSHLDTIKMKQLARPHCWWPKMDKDILDITKSLEQIIDFFGPPQMLVSDNGPPFNSYEMNKFYAKYGINHVTTPPYHPASAGLAERFVRSFKEAMIKEQQMGQSKKIIALRNVL